MCFVLCAGYYPASFAASRGRAFLASLPLYCLARSRHPSLGLRFAPFVGMFCSMLALFLGVGTPRALRSERHPRRSFTCGAFPAFKPPCLRILSEGPLAALSNLFLSPEPLPTEREGWLPPGGFYFRCVSVALSNLFFSRHVFDLNPPRQNGIPSSICAPS